MDKNFIPTVLNIFSIEIVSILTAPNVENKFWIEVLMKHLKVLVKWNWWWNLISVRTIFSDLWNLVPWVPMENFFWCYFRQLFISLTFRKWKKDCNILKIILVQGLCPLKTEMSRFRLKVPFLFVKDFWSADNHDQ